MTASPIFVPNVLIGTDANIITNIMGAGATISDLRSNPALWLFPGDGTSNLLSMEHDVLGDNESTRITLTFMDPTEVFEHRIVDTTFTGQMDNTFGFMWNLSKLAGNDLADANAAGGIGGKGDWGGLPSDMVADLEKEYPHTVKTATSFDIGPGGKAVTQYQNNEVTWGDVEPKLNKKFAQHLLQQLINVTYGAEGLASWFEGKTRQVSNKRLIISYGLGPDLASWSGPFICKIIGADYNYTADGVRTISVTLVPNLDIRFKVPLERLGYVGSITGESLPIADKKKIIDNDQANPFLTTLPSPKSQQNYPVPGANFSARDLNIIFGGVIKNYISAALSGKRNILVFLPDMNKVFGTVLTKEISDPRYQKSAIPNSGGGTFYRPFKSAIARLGERGSNSVLRLVAHSKDGKVSRKNTHECYHVKGNKNGDDFLKFGPAGNDNDDNYRLWTLVMDNTGYGNNMEPIVDLFAQINALTPVDFDWKYYEEMNADIIKILYDAGLIPDPAESVIIVGDDKIIKNLLYPSGADLQLKGNAPVLPSYAPIPPDVTFQKWVRYREKYKEWRMSKATHYYSPLIGANPAIDEFAVDASGQDFVEELEPSLAIAMRDMPVFKSGGVVPNILSLKLTTDNQYFAALQSGWSMAAYAHVLAAGEQKLTEGDTIYKNLNEIITKVKNLLPDPEEVDVINAVIENEGANMKAPTKEMMAETIIRLFENSGNIVQGNTGDILLSREHELENPIAAFLAIYKKWFNAAVRLEIETLPMFHLSDTLWLGKPCLVLINEPGITGTPPHEASTMRRSLAGAYTIIGFNHIISDDEVKSKFVLRKIPGMKEEEWGAPELVGNTTGESWHLPDYMQEDIDLLEDADIVQGMQ